MEPSGLPPFRALGRWRCPPSILGHRYDRGLESGPLGSSSFLHLAQHNPVDGLRRLPVGQDWFTWHLATDSKVGGSSPPKRTQASSAFTHPAQSRLQRGYVTMTLPGAE